MVSRGGVRLVGDVPLPFDRLSINEKIKVLRDTQVKQQKSVVGKEFKLPFSVRFGGGAKAKRGKVIVCYLQKNKRARLLWSSIESGMINIGGAFHNAAPGFLFYLGKWPFLVIKSWKINPESIDVEDFKDETAPQQITIRAIEARESMMGKKFGGMSAIWIILLLAAGAYLFFGGGMG